ncbi:hypothetical protein VPH5P1C_0038 [Vibrio phage 5P1c]
MDYSLDDKFRGVTKFIVKEFESYLSDYEQINLTKIRKDKITKVVKCWLVNSYYPVMKGRDKIHLTLSKEHYSSGAIVNGQKSNKKVSYTYTKKLLDFLSHFSYIDLVIGGDFEWGFVEGKWQPTEFTQSYAVVESKLLELYHEYDIGGCEKPLKNVMFLRNDAGDEVTFKMNVHKKEVKKYLQEYNEQSLSHTVTLGDVEFDVQSYKVYNKDLNKGGRTYTAGGSIQTLSSKERAKLLIDGKAVTILDFKGFEPSVAYQMKHLVKPEDDPYCVMLDGIDPSIMRDIVKKALLIMFNTESRTQAEQALTSALRKTYDAKALYEAGKIYCPVFPVRVILDMIEDYHYMIQDMFYCNFGYQLQYAGGLINDYVCNYFLQNTEHLIVQVHDAFIGTYNIENELRDVMYQGFEVILGGKENCHITKEA